MIIKHVASKSWLKKRTNTSIQNVNKHLDGLRKMELRYGLLECSGLNLSEELLIIIKKKKKKTCAIQNLTSNVYTVQRWCHYPLKYILFLPFSHCFKEIVSKLDWLNVTIVALKWHVNLSNVSSSLTLSSHNVLLFSWFDPLPILPHKKCWCITETGTMLPSFNLE